MNIPEFNVTRLVKKKAVICIDKFLSETKRLVVIANEGTPKCGNLRLNQIVRLLHEYIRNDKIQFRKEL